MLKVLPSEGELEVLGVCKGELKCKIKWMRNACKARKDKGKPFGKNGA